MSEKETITMDGTDYNIADLTEEGKALVESLKFVEKSFLLNDALIFELMEKDTIVEMVKEHLSGKKNRRLLIWSLLNFEQLLKEF